MQLTNISCVLAWLCQRYIGRRLKAIIKSPAGIRIYIFRLVQMEEPIMLTGIPQHRDISILHPFFET